MPPPLAAPTAIRLPLGVRDFLPGAAAARRRVQAQVVAAVEAWGYARIITPAFECADVLALGLGAAADAEAVRFVEPGSGEVVALRPDFTPQVARMVATRFPATGLPVRLCYEGAVTRTVVDRGPRELLQVGVELIDAELAAGDAELIALAAVVLAAVGLDAPVLELGHVAPVQHVLASVPTPVAEALRLALARGDRAAVARAVDSETPVVRELALALVSLHGAVRDVLPRALALPWPTAVHDALSGLAQAIAGATALVGDGGLATLRLDLGEVRGADYYTGLRVSAFARGAAEPVLRGGRYDDLIGRYGAPRRAVGLAADVEAMTDASAEAASTSDGGGAGRHRSGSRACGGGRAGPARHWPARDRRLGGQRGGAGQPARHHARRRPGAAPSGKPELVTSAGARFIDRKAYDAAAQGDGAALATALAIPAT
jgi:ATP phosphoribosyltransferase regulatory subunit